MATVRRHGRVRTPTLVCFTKTESSGGPANAVCKARFFYGERGLESAAASRPYCKRSASTALPQRCHRVPPKAPSRPKTGSEVAFRRNTAACVHTIEAAHNPEVAGSNPAPATQKAPETGLFRFTAAVGERTFCPSFALAHTSNALGYLRIMFAVQDIDDTLDRLRSHGAELVGELAQYEDKYRLCYVRGPEGILVGLAEQIG